MIGQLCLIGMTGDLSRFGGGARTVVYLFPAKYKPEVDEYLRAQLEWSLETLNADWPEGSNGEAFKRHFKAFRKLKSLKIFNDKYDFNTGWEMRYFDEGELQGLEPFHVSDNFNILEKHKARKHFKIFPAKKKSILSWFGERGISLEGDKLTSKGIHDPHEGIRWLFIHNHSEDESEVELYQTNGTLFAEPYDAWDAKGFDWSRDNLASLIPKGETDDWWKAPDCQQEDT